MCEMRVHSLINSECLLWAGTVLRAGSREHRRQQGFHRWKWKSCPTLWTPWTTQSMDSPGQSTGVGSRSLLQGIFPTQGSNPGLPQRRRILYSWATREAPLPLREMANEQTGNLLFIFQVKVRRVNLGERCWRDRWMFFRRMSSKDCAQELWTASRRSSRVSDVDTR